MRGHCMSDWVAAARPPDGRLVRYHLEVVTFPATARQAPRLTPAEQLQALVTTAAIHLRFDGC